MDFQEYFLHPEHYNHKIKDIKFIETHISLVCLTGDFVYKVKKPVQFGGILDFSTLKKRQFYCQEELRLNKRFSPSLYEEIVSLTPNKIYSKLDSRYEFAVKMKQLPQKYIMENVINKKKSLSSKTMYRLSSRLINFYTNAENKPSGGKVGQIKQKIEENFSTLYSLNFCNSKYEGKVKNFMKNNKELFNQRVKNKLIKDGHGDLQPKNIFILPNDVFIFDCIEFNELLRYVDILEDLAFLLMEFDRFNLHRESDYLIAKFKQISNEIINDDLLNFYKSYRAAVRIKVSLFRKAELNQDEVSNEATISNLNKDIERYSELAFSYMGI